MYTLVNRFCNMHYAFINNALSLTSHSQARIRDRASLGSMTYDRSCLTSCIGQERGRVSKTCLVANKDKNRGNGAPLFKGTYASPIKLFE
jgi:hypothetical protein